MKFDIKNAETGLCHDTIAARSETEALQRFRASEEYIVTFPGRGVSRPYVTGPHGVCYIAERVREEIRT